MNNDFVNLKSTTYENLLLFLALASFLHANGQDYIPNYLLEDNDFINDNFEVMDSSGWFRALPESAFDAINFLSNNKEHFGMSGDDDFTEVRVTDDNDYPFMNTDDRFTHTRYNQTYKGINVEYAEFFIHALAGEVRFINAKLAEGLDMPVTPALNETEALDAAIEHLGENNEYSWLNPDFEAMYKDEKEDSNATSYPEGELLIAKLTIDQNYAAEEFVLAWKFRRIISLNPRLDVTVYIDANSGEVFKQSDNILHGQADLLHGYGTGVYIDTRWRGGLYNHHVLRSDDSGAPKIWSKEWVGAWAFGGYNCITGFPCTRNSFDTDNIWQTDKAKVTTPHWIATRTWHYYNDIFNRNSYDNAGSEVKILANTPDKFASWSPESEVIMIGNVDGVNLATKDLVGHEFTHGVIQYTADLVYEKESGALNESFADIFGYDFERYMNNGVHTNWDLGEDAVLRRRMNDPLSKDNPAFYKGLNWVSTDNCTPTVNNDKCGVHTNSGVQNYWFYLLTDGSVGAPNGTYNNVPVNGIGADKARNIVYYSMVNILGANSAYPDARNGAILAAMSLYGECSNELTQTINAWAAVGLNGPRLPLTIEGPDIILYSATTGSVTGSMPKTFTANNGSSRNYDWTYSGPWTYVVNSTNFKRDNEFSVTDFNNSFTASVITVTDGCSSVSKTVHFLNTDNLIVISPNPVLNIMNVSVGLPVVDEANPVSAAIYDLSGNLKFNGSFDVSDFSIDVSSLPVGNYYLNIEQGEYSGSKQFIKQ